MKRGAWKQTSIPLKNLMTLRGEKENDRLAAENFGPNSLNIVRTRTRLSGRASG
jgi:hypothetical protein